MTEDIEFFTNPMSRGRIVRWMLEELSVPYTAEIVPFGPVMKRPEYLAINPAGPEGNAGLAEPVEIEGVDTARGGVGVHAREMVLDQRLRGCAGKIVNAKIDHGAAPSLSSSLIGIRWVQLIANTE